MMNQEWPCVTFSFVFMLQGFAVKSCMHNYLTKQRITPSNSLLIFSSFQQALIYTFTFQDLAVVRVFALVSGLGLLF